MLKSGLKIVFVFGFIIQGLLLNAQDSLDWKLLEAAFEGDTNLVAQLLEKGADPNAVAFDSTTALMYASAGGHQGIVWILLEEGADVNLGTSLQASPLIGAAGGGYMEICRILLADGADPNQKDPSGKTALMYSSSMNNTDIAWLLLEYDASPEIRDFQERRATHYAADYGAYEVLGLLLDAGAEACPQDADGATPLQLAASYDDIAMVELLMNYGCHAGITDNKGMDAATHAVIHQSAGVVTFLMDRDRDESESEDGKLNIDWKNSARFALKTGQRGLYKAIKDSTGTRIRQLIIYAGILNIQASWNSMDHLVKASYNWIEGHSNIYWGIGFGMRISPVRILVKEKEYWYQYRERIFQLNAKMGRTFSLAAGSNLVFDFSPGIGAGVNWSYYRGTSMRANTRYSLLAMMKTTARWNNFGISGGVSWSSLAQERISPIYIDVGFDFRFNRLNFKKVSHIL